MSIQFCNAKSPVFMRVRRTVPQFTFSLSAHFVNSLSSVSTGFFRFFSVLFENRYIFLINPAKLPSFRRNDPRQQLRKLKTPQSFYASKFTSDSGQRKEATVKDHAPKNRKPNAFLIGKETASALFSFCSEGAWIREN
jgi:hypothetical protein